MTIAEALQAGNGKSVELRGVRVNRVFDAKSGANDKGVWTRQDMEIQDSTGTIKVEWWGFDLGKQQLQGQLVDLTPVNGRGCFMKEKQGMNGRPNSLVISCKDSGTVKLSQGGQQSLPVGQGGQPASVGVAAVRGVEPIALTQYLNTAQRISVFCRAQLSMMDDQAIAAVIDTAMIAITGGRVSINDPLDDGPPDDDPHSGYAQ